MAMAVTLLLAACGDSGDDDAPSAAPGDTEATEPAAGACPDAPFSGTIERTAAIRYRDWQGKNRIRTAAQLRR